MDTDVGRADATQPDREVWDAFVLEQRGIDWIPPSDRASKPTDMFWMWLGALTNVAYILYGAIVTAFLGVSLAQAIVIIVIGSVFSYAIMAVVGLAGPASGTGIMATSRAPYGANPNRAISVFNYGTILGYEILDIAIIVLALLALFGEAGVESSTGLKIGMIAVAFALQIPLPLYGHATVVKALKVLSVIFVAFTIVLAILVAGKVDVGSLKTSGGFAALSVTLAFVISVGGLGWANYAGDYSRYIPANASRKQVFLWQFLGAAVPSILLEILGAAIGTTFPAGDVVSGLREAVPSWFAVPYLILVVAMILAINCTGYYS